MTCKQTRNNSTKHASLATVILAAVRVRAARLSAAPLRVAVACVPLSAVVVAHDSWLNTLLKQCPGDRHVSMFLAPDGSVGESIYKQLGIPITSKT